MRKLARAAIAFSAAVFAANYILSPEYIFALASVLLFLGIMLCLLRAKGLRPIAVILIFFALGLFCFRIHYQNTYLTAKEYAGERHKISAEVLDYPQEYKDYLRLEVRITSGYLPNFKSLLYDNEKALIGVKPGDSISFYGRINTADTIYGEKYSNYHSNGFYFKLTPLGRIKIERSGFDIFMLPKYVSNFLSSRIGEIFNDDVSVFMRSLMLGDKADFYEDESLYVDMSRAGLMHIVAVSGMHISFLVSLLHFILGEGRRSAVICLMLVWFFALVTGAGPSVLRASFMYTTMLMAPVLRRENDTITSMSAILALILCINPYAATSVSLQLSFAAMAGIMLFTGRIYSTVSEKLGTFGEHELVRYVLVSASNSLSVMVFTVPLTALHFGTVPILSPITNLMSLWAVSYCFCGGWISCVLSYIPLLGDLSVWACSALARYIMLCAEIISSIPIAVLYIETRGAWLWVCLSYVLFTIFALL
ncbi:MAG: ComEC/Rec2 family competence protein, partial [Oscillospiraceae bacterium]|nr:ComEC/Rec2 family competence protein [Oscillospiraceae bacterium]